MQKQTPKSQIVGNIEERAMRGIKIPQSPYNVKQCFLIPVVLSALG